MMMSRRRKQDGIAPRAFSIPAFCEAYGISEDTYYKMQREGWGPKVMKVGHRTLISMEAADQWRREREAAAPTRMGT